MPTFEQFLQAETVNAKKNNSYYQQYYVNQLRAFHNQATIKQNISDNMLARRSGVEYSPGMQFKRVSSKMEETQELTMKNQPKKKRCRYGSIKHARVTSKYFPVELAIRKTKKSTLVMVLSKSEAKKA